MLLSGGVTVVLAFSLLLSILKPSCSMQRALVVATLVWVASNVVSVRHLGSPFPLVPRTLALVEHAVDERISAETQSIAKHCCKSESRLLDEKDYILQRGIWDASPIVIESHKLVFFSIPKAGCTTFKKLFRRMMGKADWQSQDAKLFLPHNPRVNGLKYLYDYPLEKGNQIMTDTTYTRAVFVRDPKLRFLSAFLDKALSNDGVYIKEKCCPIGECVQGAQTLEGFLDLVKWCKDEHWQPQTDRMESKYWKHVDFIGHLENAANDTKRMLERINAWQEFGQSGWGAQGIDGIFESTKDAGEHATWSQWEIWKWYNNVLERKVEQFYAKDYANPLFSFQKTNLVDY
jgi:Sulfotransferase family